MSNEQQTAKPTTTAGWKKSKVHAVTLPSSAVVELEIPNMPVLIKTGQIPNNLVDIAVKAARGTLEIDRDLMEQQAEFAAKIVALSCKNPVVKEEEVQDLPFEDVEMIVEIATRQRDLDALGHHVGGLHTQADFRAFRNLDFGE